MNLPSQHANRPSRRGFSLVEVAVSTLLVGVLLAASLAGTGQALLGQRQTADRAVAKVLVESMLAEIVQLAYVDPSVANPPLGLDSGESSTNRNTFDDLDDYAGHTASPPTTKAGDAIPGLTGWERTVEVVWINPATLAVSGADTGAKRITVTAKLNGTTVYSAVVFRTSAP